MKTRSKILADAIHMWLWWSTFAVRRASGSGIVSSFRAAQTATAKLRNV